jgi:CheY-like chemotaxis protein
MNEMENPTYVLLAEDDDDDFFVFSLAIEELSFKVILTRAENGDILMRLLDEKNPDILFLDIMMPCRDGRQCLKEIRANRKFDSLPIIMYTSLHDLETIEFSYREGSNLFAIKPSSLMALKDVLERVFSIDWKKLLYFPPVSKFVITPQ